MDLGRPLFYSGSDTYGAGGHAFVCDGYDNNDFFHFNWGWGGRDDAWCAIGALNTTKYAFNSYNAAIFDCYPQSDDYFSHPERITNLTLTDNSSYDGAVISWVNPTHDMAGQALTAIDTVFVCRNRQIVAKLTGVQVGETMQYTDLVSKSRLYQYSVYAKNSFGCGVPVYESFLVGEKCALVFQLNDSGGDGWKGTAISVGDAHGNRNGIITLKEGSHETQTVPLLKGDLKFIWVPGWFHNNPQYNTAARFPLPFSIQKETLCSLPPNPCTAA